MRNTYTNRYRYSYSDEYGNCDEHSDKYADFDANGDEYTCKYTDEYADKYTYEYADPNGYQYPNEYGNSYGYGDEYRNAHAHTAIGIRESYRICTTLGAPGAPYPSNITVANGPSQIDSLRITLFDVVHQLPDNMDFLLVGPNGVKFVLMADAGGALPMATPGVTLTFSDAAGQVLPDSAPLTTGTFEPTSWESGQASFAAPAPPAPYNEPGSGVGGTGTQTLTGNFRLANSNGTWSLYMRDDNGLFTSPTAITGCVNGGWQIQFIPTTAAGLGISGRVTTAGGNGIRNASVVLTGNSLTEPRVAQTGSFGYYTFDGLQAGETYVLTVNSRRYTFSLPSRVISLVDNVIDADFVADPQE